MTVCWRPALALLVAVTWGLPLKAAPVETESGLVEANISVLVQGDVSVKRKGWTLYEPVVFGTNLRRGDLVRVNPSSHAKIVCSDLTIHELLVGIAGVPCNPVRNVLLSKDGSVINATRSGPPDGSYPVVLSPRKTKLLSLNPTLQWTPVSGTHVYEVTIRGPQFSWRALGSKTVCAYPDGAPPLKPGIDYKLIVQAGDRNSEEEPGFGLGFSILDRKERASIEKEQQSIENLGLPDGPTQFLIAFLYAAHGLRAEAIQRLENASPQMKVSAVSRLLGDLYVEVALTRRAEASYLKALELTQTEGDEEGQMLVHLALGNIYLGAIGNNKLAREHLYTALALAKKIGDEPTATLADQGLAKLNKEGV
jgi:hypothetical protein